MLSVSVQRKPAVGGLYFMSGTETPVISLRKCMQVTCYQEWYPRMKALRKVNNYNQKSMTLFSPLLMLLLFQTWNWNILEKHKMKFKLKKLRSIVLKGGLKISGAKYNLSILGWQRRTDHSEVGPSYWKEEYADENYKIETFDNMKSKFLHFLSKNLCRLSREACCYSCMLCWCLF